MSGNHLRGRRFATGRLALFVGCTLSGMALLFSLSASSLCAQEALPSNPVYDATAREQMYQQLFRDVA